MESTALATRAEHGIAELERMGDYLAKSGLFGIKTKEQAIALMLVAQAEGLHPATAATDYHVIQGRPALKSDAMLARFQRSGGSVKWIEYTDARCSATFSHPQGGAITVDWDMERARKADLGKKDMWSKYPRQMLRARVISEAIRTVFPGILSGMYTPEEAADFTDVQTVTASHHQPLTKALPPMEIERPKQPKKAKKVEVPDAFSELCATENITGATLERLSEYLTQTATAHNCTVEDLKQRAIKSPGKFLASFNSWLMPIAPPIDATQEDSGIPCPNEDGRDVTQDTCDLCRSKDGCPSHETDIPI